VPADGWFSHQYTVIDGAVIQGMPSLSGLAVLGPKSRKTVAKLADVITVEGAKLLAQLMPVVLVLLIVERRWLGPEPEPLTFVGWAWFWIKGVAQWLAVGGCMMSLIPLFVAVNTNSNVQEGWDILALVSFAVVWLAAIGVVAPLAQRSYLGKDRIELGAERIRERRLAQLELRRVARSRSVVLRRKARRG
jgi:hypothetical protein